MNLMPKMKSTKKIKKNKIKLIKQKKSKISLFSEKYGKMTKKQILGKISIYK